MGLASLWVALGFLAAVMVMSFGLPRRAREPDTIAAEPGSPTSPTPAVAG